MVGDGPNGISARPRTSPVYALPVRSFASASIPASFLGLISTEFS